MSFFNPFGIFRSKGANHESKASAAGPVYSERIVGRPVWTERDFAAFAHEAYKINPVGFRCVKMIAGNAASVNWLLHDKSGKLITDHPLLRLLSRPSPVNGGSALFEAFYSYLLLSGNGYLESVGPDNKPPRELWALRSDRMRVVPGPQGIPQAFEYSTEGRKKTWRVNPVTGASEVLHVKEFNPLNDWYGMSRAEPAAYGIDRHNAASAHNKALLDNGARPSGALVLEPVKGSQGHVNVPSDIIDAAEKQLEKNHRGPGNAGKPMILSGLVKWLEMGLTPRDMDFNEGKDDAARDICIAWGVPHILIVKGSATYNNIREAKLELYEDTVLPLMGLVVDEMNNWLTPRFGDGLTLSPDLDSVSALEPRRESKRKSTVELMDKGVIDSDEAREALQYGPRDKASVKKVDATVLKALVETVDSIGMAPLLRYMKSVGLVAPGTTEKQLVDQALAFLDDDNDDEIDGNDDDESEDESDED